MKPTTKTQLLMTQLTRYVKRPDQAVTAIQIISGFGYKKWGSIQRCKKGDWLVENNGEVYTIDAESFALTYTCISPGRYNKTAPVWAEIATCDGQINTKEGVSHYKAGDYLVYNQEERKDGYCTTAEKFVKMYEPAE
jgi:hypothetical protein